MKKLALLVISLVILVFSFPVQGFEDAESALIAEKENQIIVQYKAERATVKTSRMKRVKRLNSKTHVITANSRKDMESLLSELTKDKSVEFAEKNHKFTMDSVPNDELYSEQWGLPVIKAAQCFDYSIYAKKSITVAVIDSGINATHPDLIDRIALGGYDFFLDTYDVTDLKGHGTAVSSVIAAQADNLIGIAGVCGNFDVKILPLKVASSSGLIYMTEVLEAIQYAADCNADVINMSMGSAEYDATLNSALQYAYESGCVIVASAGNDGQLMKRYPAACDNVISVGSIDSDLLKAASSTFNDAVDLTAPGVGIEACKFDGTYSSFSGTSLSSPAVAGAAAMIKALSPELSPAEIEQILKDTALDLGDVGRDDYFGYGLIQCHDAVLSALALTRDMQTVMFSDELIIQYPIFMLEDGKEALSLNNNFTIKSTLANPSESPESITVLTALYNGNKLARTVSKQVQVNANDTSNYIESIDLSEMPEFDSLKIFVFNNINSIVPVTAPIIFN